MGGVRGAARAVGTRDSCRAVRYSFPFGHRSYWSLKGVWGKSVPDHVSRQHSQPEAALQAKRQDDVPAPLSSHPLTSYQGPHWSNPTRDQRTSELIALVQTGQTLGQRAGCRTEVARRIHLALHRKTGAPPQFRELMSEKTKYTLKLQQIHHRINEK